MRNTVFILLLFFFTYGLNAQVTIPKLEWMHTISDAQSALSYSVAIDHVGNVIVAGYYDGTVDFEPGPGVTSYTAVGGFDVFVSKYTNDGSLIWAKSLGGSSYDYGYNVSVDNSNNILVTGVFRGNGDFDPGPGVSTLICNNSAYGNAFLVKLDPSGNHVWSKAFTSLSSSIGNAVIADSYDNVYALGRYTDSLDFDPNVPTLMHYSTGSDDAFLVKLDAAGNYVDAYTIGAGNFDEFTEVDIDDQDNLYIAGRFNGTIDFDQGPGTYIVTGAASYNAFILKLDDNLNFGWLRYAESTSNSYMNGVAINKLGQIYGTGQFLGTVDFEDGPNVSALTSNGNTDAFLMRLDNAGNFYWAKGIGSTSSDHGRGVDTDTLGNSYLVGTYVGTVDFDPGPAVYESTSVGTSVSSRDLFVEKFDSLGNMKWLYTAGSSGGNSVEDVVVDDSMKIYMSGTNSGTIDWAPGAEEVLINSQTADAYVHVFYQCVAGLSVDTVYACDYAIWHGNLLFQSDSTTTYTILNGAANGCDSIITLYLVMSYSTYATDVQSACSTYTWMDGNTYTASTNSPQWIIPNAAGCDSVITLNLTIENNTGTDVIYACGSHTWIDGITYYASTNTPTFTLTNAAGCDSVVTLNLHIGGPNSGTAVIQGCSSYTWINGVTYTSDISGPTHTLTNMYGCDSVVTLNLTINYPTSSTDIQTACGSYTWLDNVTYTSSTNGPIFSLVNSNGCDSVITLDLTIIPLSYGTDVVTSCVSYTWMNGVTYNASTNSPTYTLTNAAGCDSIVTLNLTIHYATSSTQSISACGPYTWLNNVTYTTSTYGPQFYSVNSNGCDSIITLDLTINSPTSGVDVVSACDNYTWIDGNNYTANTNTATWTLTNASGCDSLVTLDLTLYASSSSTIIDTALDVYTLNGTDYSSSGIYTQVIPNANGCDSTITLDLTINHTGIDAAELKDFVIFPNPSDGSLIISWDEDAITVLELQVLDNKGRPIENLLPEMHDFDLVELSSGVFYIKVVTTQGVFFKKWIRK